MMERIRDSISEAMEKLKAGTRPRPCWCGGNAAIIPPDIFNDRFSILCDKDPFDHGYAEAETEHQAILNWNSMQEGK